MGIARVEIAAQGDVCMKTGTRVRELTTETPNSELERRLNDFLYLRLPSFFQEGWPEELLMRGAGSVRWAE